MSRIAAYIFRDLLVPRYKVKKVLARFETIIVFEALWQP